MKKNQIFCKFVIIVNNFFNKKKYEKSFLYRYSICYADSIDTSFFKIWLFIREIHSLQNSLILAAILFFKMAATSNLHKKWIFCVYFLVAFTTVLHVIGYIENLKKSKCLPIPGLKGHKKLIWKMWKKWIFAQWQPSWKTKWPTK